MANIERFPDYEFLESGHVISYKKIVPRILSPIRMGSYTGLQLARSDGLLEKQYLHRLICEAFNGPCPDGMECRHLDGNKYNNIAKNLAWGTKSENNIDKNGHGTGISGEANPMAKLTEADVKRMREYRKRTGESYKKISELYGVSAMTAYRAITEQSWRANNDRP